MGIGEQIRYHRQALGMKQVDLARSVGKTSDAISQIERGRHAPSQATIDKICTTLGIKQFLIKTEPI